MNFFTIPFAFVYALIIPALLIIRLIPSFLSGDAMIADFFYDGIATALFFPILIYVVGVLISLSFVFLMKKTSSCGNAHVIFMFIGLLVALIIGTSASIIYGLLITNIAILSLIGLVVGCVVLVIFFGMSRGIALVARVSKKIIN